MTTTKIYRYLDELDGSFFIGTVRVRVLQKHSDSNIVDMIVIDQKGTPMNAKIMNVNSAQFEASLKPRHIYDISRFSTSPAKKWNRPTRHDRVMWINKNTKVELIGEVAGFPERRQLSYTKLDEASHIVERNDNTYLLDVIGVIVSVSNVNAYSSEKLKRVVGIEDNTGTKMNIVLWNEHAADFEQIEFAEKSVLALTSVAVNQFKGFGSESLTTGRFTQIFLDSDNPSAVELRKSDNYSELEKGVLLADWRQNNRKSLTEIVTDFNPDNIEGPYTCIAEIVGHTGVTEYLACKNCNTKCPDEVASFLCKRCKMQTPTHTYCRMETTITDKSSTEVVTLFGNQLEHITKLKVPTIVEMTSTVDRSKTFYQHLLGKTFVFELKPQVFSTTLALTVNRVGQVVDAQNILSSKKSKGKSSIITKEQIEPTTPSKTNLGKRKAGQLSKAVGRSVRSGQKSAQAKELENGEEEKTLENDAEE